MQCSRGSAFVPDQNHGTFLSLLYKQKHDAYLTRCQKIHILCFFQSQRYHRHTTDQAREGEQRIQFCPANMYSYYVNILICCRKNTPPPIPSTCDKSVEAKMILFWGGLLVFQKLYKLHIFSIFHSETKQYLSNLLANMWEGSAKISWGL